MYLVRVCRYVMLNPVRAGLVSTPDAWPWSSYRAFLGSDDPWLLDFTSLEEAFADASIDNVRGRLIDCVNGPFDDEISAFIRSDRRIIGSEVFATEFAKVARAASKEVPSRERHAGRPSVATIVAESLAQSNGVSFGVIRANADYGYSVTDIARSLGLSRATVGRLIRGDASAGIAPLDW
jgi:hypothetical protein